MKREEIIKTAKPILFNSEMVRAILDGRKTQTRRVIREVCPEDRFIEIDKDPYIEVVGKGGVLKPKGVIGTYATFSYDELPGYPMIKSRYEVGDILYVRETWANYSLTEGRMPEIYYKADWVWTEPKGIKWRPSIHMPKEAARLFLRVTNVSVAKLQDITEENAPSEGVTPEPPFIYMPYTRAFAMLWNSTIPKKDLDKYGWNANPYVWVITFERIEVEQ